MDRHREAIGLAVGPVDLNPIPLGVRWVYAPETLSPQARPAPPSDWPLSKGAARPQGLPWQIAHAMVWRHRTA